MIRRAGLVLVMLAVGASIPSFRFSAQSGVDTLPHRFSDQEFWRVVEEFSEPNGYFDSENLVSNEDTFQTVVPRLISRPRGGAYLGVGPDQNFTYIVALEPEVAFITDVRRGNLHLHLMYKALIEMSANRVEFLSRLFGRRPPAGVDAKAGPATLLRVFHEARPDPAFRQATLAALLGLLQRTHGFRLAEGDEAGIAAVYASFAREGPSLRFVSSRPGNRYPSFEDLQTSTDAAGVNHGYLADETRYATLRDLQERNLIVPLVGNFAGPKALRSVAAYLSSHQATVGVFYTSNVERYLFQDGLWDEFADNVASLPQDGESLIVRSCFDSCSGAGESRAVTLVDSIGALLRDYRAGHIARYGDVLAHSRRN